MTTDPQWSPCEPGTLDSLKPTPAVPLTRRRAVAAVAALAAGGGFFLLRGDRAAGISCAQVMASAHDYVDGVSSAKLTQQIDTHRQHCDACDVKLVQLETRRDQSA